MTGKLLLIGLILLGLAGYVEAKDDHSGSGDKTQPKWELGVFSALINTPEYPASSEDQTQFLAAPFVIYRGETFRLGDNSIAKAVAVEEEGFELDVSLKAAFASDSDDTDARRGMPDLDFLFEIGPEARFMLYSPNSEDDRSGELWLNLQARSVFSTDFSNLDHQGYVFEPELTWHTHDLLWQDSRFMVQFSPIFATEKAHRYLYEVSPRFATSSRPAYQADAGYMGSKLLVANTFQINKHLRLFVGGQAGIWYGAANDDSPLFEDDLTFSVALGFSWRFYQSESRVKCINDC